MALVDLSGQKSSNSLLTFLIVKSPSRFFLPVDICALFGSFTRSSVPENCGVLGPEEKGRLGG